MGKKGAALHIEMVLSFILFVGFIMFVLLYIKPYNQTPLPDSIVTGVHDLFESYVSTNLTTMFLHSNSSGCFSINLANIDLNSGSVVRNISGQLVPSFLSGNKINIQSSENFFRIYLSPDLTPSSSISCALLPSTNYSIGSSDKTTLISYLKLQQIRQEYENNYNILKQELNVPDRFDFTISANLSSPYELSKPIPQEATVFARGYMHQVLYPDGTIENKEFIIKAW